MDGNTYSIVMLVVMLAIFYFLLIRPENKRKKKAEAMREGIKKGDTVTTIGGIVGRVVHANKDTLIIETSEDRVRMEVTRWAISTTGVQTTDQPAEEKADKADKKKKKEDPAAIEEKTEAPAEEKKD